MLGSPFDAVTLDVLRAIAPGQVSVTTNREDPGATAVSLVVYETAKDDEKGEPSKKKAKRSNSFKPQQIKNLPQKLAKLKTDFRAKLRDFRSVREGQGKAPPPLNQQEKEEEERRRAAEGGESGGEGSADEASKAVRPSWQLCWWQAAGRQWWPMRMLCCLAPQWDPKVAVTAANFLEYVQTLPWYEDQVQHREEMPTRPARMCHVEGLGYLSARVKRALLDRGITQLYTHQVQALEALMGEQSAGEVVASQPGSRGWCMSGGTWVPQSRPW